MKKFWTQFFTWWNGATLGTRFYTWRKGTRVGEDEFGNVYYEGGSQFEGHPRRWVIYNGYSEASSIPPGWHGWIHHKVDVPPPDETYQRHDWEREHILNGTGTEAAYRPRGSIVTHTERPRVSGDYDAWTPGS